MSRNSHPQCFNPWEIAKPSFVIHVHILLACDYNVHHCFSAPRYLQSEDCSPTVLFQLKWVKLDSLIWLYAITLAPCLSGCKNSAFLFYSTQQLCLHVQLYIKYTLIFQGYSFSTGKSSLTDDSSTAFLCDCVAVLSSFSGCLRKVSPAALQDATFALVFEEVSSQLPASATVGLLLLYCLPAAMDVLLPQEP